jgi:hypothetical protein
MMGLGLWLVMMLLAPMLASGQPLVLRAAALITLIASGLLIYWAAAELTGAARLKDIVYMVRRRRT